MFISVLDLFKIGIGPSSSHTMGPMIAANDFRQVILKTIESLPSKNTNTLTVQCTLKGSLAFTGVGHASDKAVALGLHDYAPLDLAQEDVNQLTQKLWDSTAITITDTAANNTIREINFSPKNDIIFDLGEPLSQHPNGMIFTLLDEHKDIISQETYFSIGGGFINTIDEIDSIKAPIKAESAAPYPYPFSTAKEMLLLCKQHNTNIATMKRGNEEEHLSRDKLNESLDSIWQAMHTCIERGLESEGILPGGLNIKRRAKSLYQDTSAQPEHATLNDWLCSYAMAVNEENAAGHMVVTAPTNGAAGVIPAVLYYFYKHHQGNQEQIRDFLLTAGSIGGLIKHRSSISGAEVGCQGEVGSASAMAAAGICAVRGGTPEQIENAAEIALEHHLGLTCDPVAGLVQVPCIERNGFGAIKAITAASLALRGNGEHFMPLDNCIEAMRQTGLEMSVKYKETSLGGLAVSITEC